MLNEFTIINTVIFSECLIQTLQKKKSEICQEIARKYFLRSWNSFLVKVSLHVRGKKKTGKHLVQQKQLVSIYFPLFLQSRQYCEAEFQDFERTLNVSIKRLNYN